MVSSIDHSYPQPTVQAAVNVHTTDRPDHLLLLQNTPLPALRNITYIHREAFLPRGMAAASGVLQRSAAASMLQRSARPTPAEVAAVVRALAALHGKPNRLNHAAGLQPGCELREPHTVLDSLVGSIKN